MQPDLANCLEILAALIGIICCFINPSRWLLLLTAILVVTVCVEFTSKYLKILNKETGNSDYIYAKNTMYNLLNIVKFGGAVLFLHLLLKERGSRKGYLSLIFFITLFVFVNLFFGQGYKDYNNYSAIAGIMLIVPFALWKLRGFDGEYLAKWKQVAVLLFLFLFIFFYAVNLPFFVFFQQMITDKSKAVTIYKAINGNANCIFYAGLSVGIVLYNFSDRNNIAAQTIAK